MDIFEEPCVKEFIRVVIEENNNESDKLSETAIEGLRNILVNSTNLIHIMFNFAEINNMLHRIKFIVKFNIYWHIFNGDIYTNVYTRLVGTTKDGYVFDEDEYAKIYFYSAIICETVKLKFAEEFIGKLSRDDDVSTIVKFAIIETVSDKVKECKTLIQQIYGYVKKHFSYDEIYDASIRLLFENGSQEYVKF